MFDPLIWTDMRYWFIWIACSDWKWQLWCHWHYRSQCACIFAQILASRSWKTINTHWIVWWMRQVCREFRSSHRHRQCFTRFKPPYCLIHDRFSSGKSWFYACDLFLITHGISSGIQSRGSDTIYTHECQQSCHGLRSQLSTMPIRCFDNRVPKLKVRTSLCQNIDHRHANWKGIMCLWWWSSLGQEEEFRIVLMIKSLILYI